MSGFVPVRAVGPDPERDHHALVERRRTVDESRRSWAVRAAQWQARALAEEIFGGAVACTLIGTRTVGPMRGVLRMEVPFGDLESHRRLEARFLASAALDPVLSAVPLVYVVGPDAA